MIREINENDIDALLAMRIDEQRELYGDVSGYDSFCNDVRDFFLSVTRSSDKITLVDEEDGDIVATCSFNVSQQPPQLTDNGRYAYMCNAYTKPFFRRQGRQKRLFEEGVKRLKEKDVASIFFDSISPNEINFALCKGFVRRNDYFSLKL